MGRGHGAWARGVGMGRGRGARLRRAEVMAHAEDERRRLDARPQPGAQARALSAVGLIEHAQVLEGPGREEAHLGTAWARLRARPSAA
jgi:hypothetical protein